MKPINQIGKLKIEHKKSYEIPLILSESDIVLIIKKESEYDGWIWVKDKNNIGGWIPEYYIITKDGISKSLCDYNSNELNAEENEQVYIHYEVLNWFYCSNLESELGWLPKDKLIY